ncbi:MAG: hypothetical protein A2Z25_17110 [Planctomycetes bacterium RBG_16_55_9]|nr:MAG: hypothetical protein A2Z25_17110 [Planctomycetes bacterium RBG_16_55_9]
MYGHRPLSFGSRVFAVLLALSVAVNGTQAVVLCIGFDGHVAVKLAGHRHCERAYGSQEAADGTEAFAAEQDACGPCVDAPLSAGISNGPGAEKTPEMTALADGIAPAVPEIADHGLEAHTAAGARPAFTSFYHPLSSIILIV